MFQIVFAVSYHEIRMALRSFQQMSYRYQFIAVSLISVRAYLNCVGHVPACLPFVDLFVSFASELVNFNTAPLTLQTSSICKTSLCISSFFGVADEINGISFLIHFIAEQEAWNCWLHCTWNSRKVSLTFGSWTFPSRLLGRILRWVHQDQSHQHRHRGSML